MRPDKVTTHRLRFKLDKQGVLNIHKNRFRPKNFNYQIHSFYDNKVGYLEMSAFHLCQ